MKERPSRPFLRLVVNDDTAATTSGEPVEESGVNSELRQIKEDLAWLRRSVGEKTLMMKALSYDLSQILGAVLWLRDRLSGPYPRPRR